MIIAIYLALLPVEFVTVMAEFAVIAPLACVSVPIVNGVDITRLPPVPNTVPVPVMTEPAPNV